MKEMKNYLEGEFSKLVLKMDEARRAAIGDVITELRGDLSNSIQFLTSVQEGGLLSWGDWGSCISSSPPDFCDTTILVPI